MILRQICVEHERLKNVDQGRLLAGLTPLWELLERGCFEDELQTMLAVYGAVLAARSARLREAAGEGYEPLAGGEGRHWETVIRCGDGCGGNCGRRIRERRR